MNVRLTLSARRDLIDRILWFDAERVGLGDEFNDAVEAALHAILESPRLSPPTDVTVPGVESRAYPMPKFGHWIVYAVYETEIVVVAIDRGRRQPHRWRGRLTEE